MRRRCSDHCVTPANPKIGPQLGVRRHLAPRQRGQVQYWRPVELLPLFSRRRLLAEQLRRAKEAIQRQATTPEATAAGPRS